MTLGAVDGAARAVMAERDAGHLCIHGLGHGVGLEIHERPFFTQDGETKIDTNTVVTVEPGAYLPDTGGVRIEDTLVVTLDGYRNLTNFPHDLITLS